MYGSNCKGAEEEGVSILHGNRGVYHDDKQPAFKVIYDAIRDVCVTSVPLKMCCNDKADQKKKHEKSSKMHQTKHQPRILLKQLEPESQDVEYRNPETNESLQ